VNSSCVLYDCGLVSWIGMEHVLGFGMEFGECDLVIDVTSAFSVFVT